MGLLLKIDAKRRILIPAYVRRKLGLRRVVKVHIEADRLIIEPVEDPVEALAETVIKGSEDIEEEITGFRRVSNEEAVKRVKDEWL